MTEHPIVSVLMTAYNEEQFIGQSIASILAQTLKELEIVIVDDGSIDNTRHIVENYMEADQRIKLIPISHSGRVAALNAGINAAQGELIAIFDSDDVSDHRRLQNQTTFLARHPEISLIGSWCTFRSVSAGTQWMIRRPTDDKGIRAYALRGNPIPHTTLVFRRDILPKVGGYRARGFADYDFVIRALREFQAANLPASLVTVNVHRNSVMTSLRWLQHFKRGMTSRVDAINAFAPIIARPAYYGMATAIMTYRIWQDSRKMR